MKSTLQMGHLGERIALNYLLDKKYVLIEKNWRHFKKEIDIILLYKQHIVFVEVKLRSTSFSSMNYIISVEQEKRLLEAMDCYIKEKKIDLEPRFDLIFVSNFKERQKINHFPSFIQPRI